MQVRPMGTIDRSYYEGYRYTTTVNDAPSYGSRTVLYSNTRTGANRPGWKTAISNHSQAGTNLSGRKEWSPSKTRCSGFCSYTNVNRPDGLQRMTVKGHLAAVRYGGTLTAPSISLSAAQNSAMSKALKQIHQAKSQFQGGVFLGEMREALHMLRHPAEGLMKAVQSDYLDAVKRKKNQLRRGKPLPTGKDKDRWKKAVSQTWLEGTFGWLPFLNDLEDAGKAYQSLCDNGTRFEKFRAVGKTSQQLVSSTTEQAAIVGDFYWLGSTQTFEESRCIIRGEVKIQAATTSLEKARLFGLSPGEFVPTLWELLPWSFLVDYFTNIGDILENSVTDTSGITWSMMTNVQRKIGISYIRPDVAKTRSLHSTDAKFNAGGSGSFYRNERKTVGRSIDPALTVPPLMLEIPGSPAKWANMLALWTQANSIHPQNYRFLGGRRIS